MTPGQASCCSSCSELTYPYNCCSIRALRGPLEGPTSLKINRIISEGWHSNCSRLFVTESSHWIALKVAGPGCRLFQRQLRVGALAADRRTCIADYVQHREPGGGGGENYCEELALAAVLNILPDQWCRYMPTLVTSNKNVFRHYVYSCSLEVFQSHTRRWRWISDSRT